MNHAPAWIPNLHPTIQNRMANAEDLLASGQVASAAQHMDNILELLNDDDPGNPSFVKAYVMSRLALVHALQGKSQALEEISRCCNYLQQWDSPDGLYRLSAAFESGRIQRLLGQLQPAQRQQQGLFDQLKDSPQPERIGLARAAAAELAELGAPPPPEHIPAAPLRPQPPPAQVDFRFCPRFSHRFSVVPAEWNGGTYSAGDGSAAWFNPRSQADLSILLSRPQALMETDDPQVLARIGDPQYAPHHQFVLYQPWREPLQGTSKRLLGASMPDMLGPAGQSLKGSPVRHLFLITGGIFRGALAALSQGLAGHSLETLGLVWHFTGDDITDVPTMADEIADCCAACNVQRLSLLTAAMNRQVEQQLANRLAQLPQLLQCQIFEKDRSSSYPRFPTPILEAALRR